MCRLPFAIVTICLSDLEARLLYQRWQLCYDLEQASRNGRRRSTSGCRRLLLGPQGNSRPSLLLDYTLWIKGNAILIVSTW